MPADKESLSLGVVPRDPDAASRVVDDVTRALDEVAHRIHAYHEKGFTVGYIEAREMVRESFDAIHPRHRAVHSPSD